MDNGLAIGSILERLEGLERENRRLARGRRRQGWALAMVATLGVAWAGGGQASRPLAAQEPKVKGETPNPLPPDPIDMGIGTRLIESGQFLLRDEAGNLLAVLAVNRDGTPILSLHARNQSARMFFRVSPEGEPGIIFLDRDGRNPVEVVVSRAEGGPSLRAIDRGNAPLFEAP